MTTPDHTTGLVLARLADLEVRIAAGEQAEPQPPAMVNAPGRATLTFGTGDLTLEQQAQLQRRWLARHAMPVELRAQFEEEQSQ